MFARNISIHLKPNMLNEFTIAFENEVVPILRKQAGFRDEMVFSGDNPNNVTAISLWDTQQQADAYATSTYGEVVKMLDKYLDGPPKVRVMNVINSTSHKLTAAVVAA
jgi:quinol monooxygenase YgiN